MSSTTAADLTFTFDETGARADIHSSIEFSASKTAGFTTGTASTTTQGEGSGFEFALEIDKDHSGNIPVGQQSVIALNMLKLPQEYLKLLLSQDLQALLLVEHTLSQLMVRL